MRRGNGETGRRGNGETGRRQRGDGNGATYVIAAAPMQPQKKPKNRARAAQNRPPPLEKNSTFPGRPIAWGRYSTQILYSSNNFSYLCDSPFKIMIMIGRKLGIGNSIYQGGYAGPGAALTVKDGRLINNSVDGQTGIAQLSKLRKEAKREEKIGMIAEGYSRGEMMSEAREMIMSPFKLKL